MQTTTVRMPSKESVTASQVNTLMSALNQLGHTATMFRDEDSPVGGENDGGASCALEATIIGVCRRMDDILTDTSRWSVNDVDEVQKSFKGIQDAHLRVLDHQQEALRVMSLPSVRLRPALSFIDGCWVAVYGEAGKLENRVIGLGNTPLEAMLDFDKAFGESKPQLPGGGSAGLQGLNGGLN